MNTRVAGDGWPEMLRTLIVKHQKQCKTNPSHLAPSSVLEYLNRTAGDISPNADAVTASHDANNSNRSGTRIGCGAGRRAPRKSVVSTVVTAIGAASVAPRTQSNRCCSTLGCESRTMATRPSSKQQQRSGTNTSVAARNRRKRTSFRHRRCERRLGQEARKERKRQAQSCQAGGASAPSPLACETQDEWCLVDPIVFSEPSSSSSAGVSEPLRRREEDGWLIVDLAQHGDAVDSNLSTLFYSETL